MIRTSILILLAVLSSSTSSWSSSRTIASDFKLQDYKAESWGQGLDVIVVEDHTLPSVSFGLLVKEGSSSDPMAKSGLMNLMARSLVRATKQMPAAVLADTLGYLGTEIGAAVSDDGSWVQLGGLSNHQKVLADLFTKVILEPRFDTTDIDLEKKNMLAVIKKRVDSPDNFADQAFESFLYGGHPYARPTVGLAVDVKSINRKNIVDFYTAKFRPENSILVVTGDVTLQTLTQLKSVFSKWQKGKPTINSFVNPPEIKGINIRAINKSDLTQTQIVLGHLGIKRSDPDFLTLRVANNILGGSFSSRLMAQVRVKLGLTYGISSSFEANMNQGAFKISTFTKNNTTGQTLKETMNVLKEFYKNGVSKDEVEATKNYLIGTFPQAIETSERLGYNLAMLKLYGISDDYLKNYVKNISNISVSDVNRAIKKHLRVDDMKVIVLTNGAETLDQIRPLGLLEVKNHDQIF